MELLGRPPPADGLKFLVNAGSPDPVMTRHLCAVLTLTTPAPSVAAGAEALLARNARAATDRTPVASERVRVMLRIGSPFSPGCRAVQLCSKCSVNVSGTGIPCAVGESQAEFRASSGKPAAVLRN